MGNMACVPPGPGGLRSSFRRKPSLKKEQNSKKKLPSFFGIDGSQERDTTTDKILQYIPAKIIQKQENQKENLDQRFNSLFKKGRRKTVVRNLGKMIYYSKVKFKFQHCQEVNSCFLELFQSYLYFQSTGPNGLTYQGLLPLKELEVRELSPGQSPGQEDHAFHISGPQLNPLVVFCPSEAELKQWLYHLEKQIQLCGGSLALPLLSQSGWTPSQGDKEELRWSVQNLPVQEWRGTQRESLGEILCVSKVKLQHLPFQEQHDRLLVLYPSTLVIVSEEPTGLCFKGELPLNAIQVLFEENDKTSFLIEGRLINSIRVSCASYRDYQEWLYCLNTAQFRNADSSLSGSEGIPGARIPHPGQFTSSGRGSLSSDGRTNSWASGGRVTTLTQLSQTSGSLPDGHSFLLTPEGRLLEEPLSPGYSQPLHSLTQPSWPSPGHGELRRGNSTRKSQSRSNEERIPQNPKGEVQSPVYQQPYTAHSSQNPKGETQSPVYQQPYTAHSSQNPKGETQSPVYQQPYTAHSSQNPKGETQNPVYQQPYTAHSSQNPKGETQSPVYQQPYTAHSSHSSQQQPPGQLEMGRLLQCPGQPGRCPCPPQVSPERWHCQPLPGGHGREGPPGPIYSTPGVPWQPRARGPAQGPHLGEISSLPEEPLGPALPAPGVHGDPLALPDPACRCRDSVSSHDYAELQSFHSDLSYDNLWEAEERGPGSPCGSPSPLQHIYQV